MTDKKKIAVIGVIGAAIVAICATVILAIASNKGLTSKIEYTNGDKKATITIGEDDVTNTDSEEHGLGEVGEEVEVDNIPTVEEVEGSGPSVDINAGEGVSALPDDGEEHGLGAFIYAPVESASAFKNYTLGKCLNTDNAFGAQCWDLADVFWQNYVGRRAQTCGTGAAKGMIGDGCWQKNAGEDFEMIWDATKIQAGDWLIFTNGQWGHVGMALGNYNDGYVTLLGQNQGGGYCDGGGSSTNIININLKNFGGAFRPKDYIKPEPKPEPQPEPEPTVNVYVVKKGDTLGAIARKMGWYTDANGLFGDNGYAQKIADANGIANRGLIYPGQEIRKP